MLYILQCLILSPINASVHIENKISVVWLCPYLTSFNDQKSLEGMLQLQMYHVALLPTKMFLDQQYLKGNWQLQFKKMMLLPKACCSPPWWLRNIVISL